MPIEFRPPRDVVFSCSECGDCCRSLSVPVGPQERRILEGLDWEGKVQELVGAPATVAVRDPSGPGRRLPRNEDGSCVYLAEDQRCLIHRHFGADSKPAACRLYPFAFHHQGDAVAVDCSFSCRAVSRGEGEPLDSHQADWTTLVNAGSASEQLPYRLGPKTKLSSDLALVFQRFLEDFLSDRSLEIPQRVRRCLQFTSLATTGDPTGPMAGVMRESIAKGLQESEPGDWRTEEMDKTQVAIFHQWLFLSLNPPPPNMDLLPKPELDRVARARVRASQAFREEGGRPTVDGRLLDVSFADVLGVSSIAVESSEASILLETFLLAKLTGQRFLLAGEGSLPFIEAVPKFFVCYPMAVWTAKALAAAEGKQAMDHSHLQAGLRLVDRAMGQIATSRFPKKQARACDFVMLETEFVMAASTTVRMA